MIQNFMEIDRYQFYFCMLRKRIKRLKYEPYINKCVLYMAKRLDRIICIFFRESMSIPGVTQAKNYLIFFFKIKFYFQIFFKFYGQWRGLNSQNYRRVKERAAFSLVKKYLNRTWALSPVLRQSADILIIEAVCLIDPQCTIA